ncbi:hypothetical protein [Mucilaginibacter polytrichastri]|nr:hypothetical protein [Mucilaginibacter polytrichastri]
MAQDPAYTNEFVQKIIPPSPSAGTMSTYGNLPLNGSSGGFNYSIPLYDIKCGDISLPISANYYSTGVSVDALAGLVGMDWNLSAGGTISRVVKDFPDELSNNRWYPTSPDWANSSDEVMMKNLARESGFDGEQDWFSFNVNGLSGSFYFDANLNIHLSSDSDVTISYTPIPASNPIRMKFTIKDDRGFRYVFGGSDAYIENNTPLNGCSVETYTSYDSAWFLKEIVSPTNNVISFTYAANNFTYKTSNTFTTTFVGACPSPNNTANLAPSTNNCVNTSAMLSKVISTISFKSNSITFDYNTNRLDGGGKSLKEIKVLAGTQLIRDINFTYYTYGTASGSPLLNDSSLYYRTFLKDIEIKGNASSTEPEKYSFEYYNADQLPVRLGYNKDKYGFYNGTNNSVAFSSSLQTSPIASYLGNVAATANTDVDASYVYYGILKKITYPTKGYTEVTYEGNSDTKTIQVTTPASTYTFNLNKSYCAGADLTLSKTWTSDGTAIKISGNTMSNGNTGCTTGNYTVEIKKDNTLIATLTSPYGTAFTTNTSATCTNSFNNYAPICTVAGSTYTVTVKLSGGTAAANFVLDYLQPTVTNVEQVFYGPGARIKSVLDMSEGKTYNKKLFYYNKLANIQSANTTLQHFYEPKFYKQISNLISDCPGGSGNTPITNTFYDAVKFSITSASSYTLSRQGVCYESITELWEKDGIIDGAVERVFLSSPDSPGQVLGGQDIYDSPASNASDLTRDKINEETTYDKANNPKTKKTYHYSTLASGYQTSTIVRKNFIMPGEPDWGGAGNLATVYAAFSNYSVFLYKNYYGVIKLDTITEQEFYSSNYVQKLTIKNYGTQPHYQLQSESTTNSLGESIQTTYKYPNDLIGIEQSPYMQTLTDSLRIAEPVKICTYNSGSKLIEKHIKYSNSSATSNIILPIEVHTRKGPGDIVITSVADRKLQITKYDAYGNILEYKKENDIPVSIIWGYNNQYPILKAENVLYSQLSSYVSSLQSASNGGTLDTTSFATVKAALPNAMITVMTYSPLLGASTITDPIGNTLKYTYNSEGKLLFVKDKYDNILTENQYHFRLN